MSVISNKDFFDRASGFYDSMINFEEALERRKKIISGYLDNDILTAADLGCGSGLDSIAMALNGIAVDGFDISGEMLKVAKRNASRFGVNINFCNYSLDKIPDNYKGQYNFITSLGNTLANLTPDQLEKTIMKTFMLLEDKGHLLIQIINFSRITLKNERIVKINNSKGELFIRFYDFHKKTINFNILRFSPLNPDEYSLQTTILYSHSPEFLYNVFKEAAFAKVEFYGGLDKSKFDKNTSKDLIVFAKK